MSAAQWYCGLPVQRPKDARKMVKALPSTSLSLSRAPVVAQLRSKEYAEPAFLPAALSSLKQPTTTVSSNMKTRGPNWSTSAPSEAVSLACCVHCVPQRANTYAEPELIATSSSPSAPI